MSKDVLAKILKQELNERTSALDKKIERQKAAIRALEEKTGVRVSEDWDPKDIEYQQIYWGNEWWVPQTRYEALKVAYNSRERYAQSSYAKILKLESLEKIINQIVETLPEPIQPSSYEDIPSKISALVESLALLLEEKDDEAHNL